MRVELSHAEAVEVQYVVALLRGVKGEVLVTACALCAVPTWRSTDGSKPDKVVVEVDGSICRGCDRVAQLHPEVFAWVRDVLVGQRAIAQLSARHELQKLGEEKSR